MNDTTERLGACDHPHHDTTRCTWHKHYPRRAWAQSFCPKVDAKVAHPSHNYLHGSGHYDERECPGWPLPEVAP